VARRVELSRAEPPRQMLLYRSSAQRSELNRAIEPFA
jgi:hypothetical protein